MNTSDYFFFFNIFGPVGHFCPKVLGHSREFKNSAIILQSKGWIVVTRCIAMQSIFIVIPKAGISTTYFLQATTPGIEVPKPA